MNFIVFKPVSSYQRKKRLRKDGTSLLYIQAYQKGAQYKYYGTGIYLTPEQWDTKRNIIIRHRAASALQQRLNKSLAELQKLQ
ncbi:MAG TPA: Arm DNA-binding domain-containing protein, partial [Saprospiraceae bacterium]|nr:Arm DNA-binding domain-containing protein [Saprospiraceae bacterium]